MGPGCRAHEGRRRGSGVSGVRMVIAPPRRLPGRTRRALHAMGTFDAGLVRGLRRGRPDIDQPGSPARLRVEMRRMSSHRRVLFSFGIRHSGPRWPELRSAAPRLTWRAELEGAAVPRSVSEKEPLVASSRARPGSGSVIPRFKRGIGSSRRLDTNRCVDCGSSVDAPTLVVGERWWCDRCLIATRERLEQHSMSTSHPVAGRSDR